MIRQQTREPRFTCESCGSADHKVIEMRPQSDYVRRRIACRRCNHRITTYEISERKFALCQSALAAQVSILRVAGKLRAIADDLELP